MTGQANWLDHLCPLFVEHQMRRGGQIHPGAARSCNSIVDDPTGPPTELSLPCVEKTCNLLDGQSMGLLSHGEGVNALGQQDVETEEPTLVTGLVLHDVQVTTGGGGGEKLVATTLVTVGGTGQQLVGVVGLTILGDGTLVQQGGGGDLAVGESSLGDGLTLPGLNSQQVDDDLVAEVLNGSALGDAVLADGTDNHGGVGHLVEVILPATNGSGELVVLLGGVELTGHQRGPARAGDGEELLGILLLSEDVGGVTVGGESRGGGTHGTGGGNTGHQSLTATSGGGHGDLLVGVPQEHTVDGTGNGGKGNPGPGVDGDSLGGLGSVHLLVLDTLLGRGVLGGTSVVSGGGLGNRGVDGHGGDLADDRADLGHGRGIQLLGRGLDAGDSGHDNGTDHGTGNGSDNGSEDGGSLSLGGNGGHIDGGVRHG